MKTKILLRAPLLSVSGYGIHSRQVFEWLQTLQDVDLTVEILKWGMTSWVLDKELDNGIYGRIMSKSKEVSPPYDVTFQVQLPDEWDANLGKRNIGISAFVETDRINPAWIENCNKMDAIIVPSTFIKTVVKKSGMISTPIHVIPEWYNENIDNNDLETINLNLNPKFNFLMIGTITSRNADDDRKNIFYALKWFCEEFADDKKVGLVLKSSFGRGTTIDRKLTTETVKNVLKEVRKGKFPKVTVVHGNLNQSEVASIYRHKKIKCMLSATRGEGYGLPLIEAAASGMPVAVTGWSGHNEFLSKEKYININYELKEITKNRVDNRIFVDGARWAQPNEEDFKCKIRSVVKNYNSCVKNAAELKLEINNNFSKNAVIKKYSKFFDDFVLINK